MKTYKKFFIKTLIFMLAAPVAIIILALLSSDYFIGKGFIKYGESQMVYKWFTQKKEAAKKLDKKGPKLVFLSGSNTLFGVNAERIEKETGIPSLNYGSHGGLTSYIFYDAKRVLKPEDVVIMPLEYQFYLDDNEINSLQNTAIEYAISYDNEYYKQLSITNKLKIIKYLLQVKTITCIGKTVEEEFKLSSRGDTLDNIGVDKDFKKTAKYGKLSSNKVTEKSKKWELYKFINWCKDNNIKMYAFAPNMYHQSTITLEEQQAFEQIKKFYDLAGVKFIGSAQDGFFELEDMYNTIYHINLKGQKTRTDYFIKKIKEHNIRPQ